MYEPPTTLARGDGRLGGLVLRRRGRTSPIYELIVNGVFLMDTAETSSERLLADAVLQRSQAPRHVVVGGLGLGYTVKALLADQRIERIDVIEIEPLLVEWLRADLVPGTAAILSDQRVRVTIGDVTDTFADAAPASYDVALLDVDNGPDFLVHERNAPIYQEGVLSAAGRALRPGGILAVWSAAPSASLSERLAAAVGPVEEVTAEVTRDGRALSYYLYLATAAPTDR